MYISLSRLFGVSEYLPVDVARDLRVSARGKKRQKKPSTRTKMIQDNVTAKPTLLLLFLFTAFLGGDCASFSMQRIATFSAPANLRLLASTMKALIAEFLLHYLLYLTSNTIFLSTF